MQSLLEPFAVALENDHRLRELVALRESLEADKRSLLSRLDRHDISDSIVGAETGLKPVMEQIELVAHSDTPVLILGETGAGKEVVARAIHQRSRRTSGPFLRVNCGAIAPDLVDSELFGHERGSFTGAVGTRQGWFERADGGTLFLDECGELTPAAQVRLLRILQDGTFERVGGERALHVDVRIVAATHRDLAAMTEDGRFRQDLWYRLAVFPIRLPPLRDRPADISALAAHFALRRPSGWGCRRWCRRPRTSTCSSPIPGPATCASWRPSSSAPRSSAAAVVSTWCEPSVIGPRPRRRGPPTGRPPIPRPRPRRRSSPSAPPWRGTSRVPWRVAGAGSRAPTAPPPS